MRLRILWIGLAAMLSAQEPADPPARVARLNYLDGWVSFRPGSLQEWAPATLNFPLTTGDHLWTDRDARAELHIGASAIHMAPWTAFAIMRLDDWMAQLSVTEGTVYLRIPRLDEGEVVEVDTPNGAVTVLRPGDYRVDIDPGNDATSVTVRAGAAEVSGNGRVTLVPEGQMLQIVASAEVAGSMDAPPPDPWEDWCVGRDRLSERAMEISESYVPPEMEGAEDLGTYGDWSTDAIYGDVWTPRSLPVGWAPYRCGHWAYVAPWGWTWIDDAPWGFAPFHYGRWVQVGFRWVWVPGNRVTRPVYSPAMVVFVASGAARNGRVTAWIPLAPGEMFRPNYRASEAYIRRINLPNMRHGSDVTLAVVSYLNRTHGTAVPQETFAGARPVSSGAVRFPVGVKPVSIVDASPSRESYLGRQTQSGVKVAAPPPQVTERAVIVRQELPPEVRPAAPIRGAVRPPESSPVSPSPQSNLPPPERQARREEAQPESPTYIALPPVRPQRQEETRSEAPPQRHEETRQEAAPPPSIRHEEARHEAPPQRHEETRSEAPPQRHEETRHEAPPAAPQHHEESRPAAQPARSEDKKDDSSNSSRKK